MKATIKKVLISAVAAVMLLSMTGCHILQYTYDSAGNRINNYSVDYIQEKYTADECCAEAERLFGTQFEIVSSRNSPVGHDISVYTLSSEDIPFEFSVFSDREPYLYNGDVFLYAHAYCDYYEQMMKYKADDASAIADKLDLQVEISGQCARVTINSYNQLEAVFDYLNDTNELYDFSVIESEMTNILRDIRTRPTLDVYLDSASFDIPEEESHVIKLYYTINNDTYYYTKNALLPTMQETYIEAIDRLGVYDSAVTSKIREERCKPALSQLCINGVPVESKDCGDFVLDPNIVFDYNWLMNDYYGDIRICAPAFNYNSAPDLIGDDRNFKYLVELLGGQYKSWEDVCYTPTTSYYMAQWWLGGKNYGAGAMCQEYIPTMSAYSIDSRGIDIDHVYSKEMWGLENGYGPEDYYIRLTPEALGTLLGVTVEADYENGTLNLITPEGYFDFEPPVEDDRQGNTELFFVEDVYTPEIGKTATHYIIYKQDGSVIEDRVTEDFTYAECKQMSTNIVMLKTHGTGRREQIVFFDTMTGDFSDIYNYAVCPAYPYVVYSTFSSGEIYVENVISGNKRLITDAAFYSQNAVIDAVLSEDYSNITLTYYKLNFDGYSVEVTEVFPIVLPL